MKNVYIKAAWIWERQTAWSSLQWGGVFRAGEDYPARCAVDEHDAPQKDCTCGFYAVRTGTRGIWRVFSWYYRGTDIVAVIPHGKTYDDGAIVRSERMTFLGPVELTSILPGRAKVCASWERQDIVELARCLRLYRDTANIGNWQAAVILLNRVRYLLGLPKIDDERKARILNKYRR